MGCGAGVLHALDIADELDRVLDVVVELLQERLHNERLRAWYAQRGSDVVVVETVGLHVADGGFFE